MPRSLPVVDKLITINIVEIQPEDHVVPCTYN